MATWYHHLTWQALRRTWVNHLHDKFGVVIEIHGLLPRPPFVLMATHSNAYDPYVIGSLLDEPLRYMANIEGVAPWKTLFAEALGAYARRKGQSDIAALRKTIELVHSGDAVGLFPEGDRSWDGRSEKARPGSARLLKRLGVDLVLVRQKGSYLSFPRWAGHPRSGHWSLDVRSFGADEIGRLSEPLLDALITGSLRRDEVREAASEGRRFEAPHGAAEGVGRILWRCPVCRKTDGITGEGDDITCVRCGARWHMDANLFIEPANHSRALHATQIADLLDWHDWQRDTLPDLMVGGTEKRPCLTSHNVSLARRAHGGLERLGHGTLSYGGGELVFQGSRGRAVFEPAAVRGFVDNFNRYCEFSHRGERWRANFNGGNAAKWIFALRSIEESRQPSSSKGAAA